jgi:hypothetical protein
MTIEVDNTRVRLSEKGIITKDKRLKNELEGLVAVLDKAPQNGNPLVNAIFELYDDVKIIDEGKDQIN